MDLKEETVKQIHNSKIENVKSLRDFMQTACIISGALASFSMMLLQFVDAKDCIKTAILFFLFSIAVGLYRLKVIIEKDMIDLNNLHKWLLENDVESLNTHLSKNKDKPLDYTPDFIVYPIIGGLVAIFLAFIF